MIRESPRYVSVQLDDREVQVDVSPLSVASANFRTKTVSQPSPNLFVIKPSVGDRVFSLAFTGMGSIALIGGVFAVRQDKGAWIAIGVGGLFVMIGLAMLRFAKSFCFDRKRETLMTGKMTRRLKEILAVQVISGGCHSGSKGGGYATYQLNLIFDDAEKSRLNLSNHAHRSWTDETGRRLAEFLNVPLLNQLQDGR